MGSLKYIPFLGTFRFPPTTYQTANLVGQS